ncbi:hypothetical protein Tco_0399511 [Tanacetum coccineum]
MLMLNQCLLLLKLDLEGMKQQGKDLNVKFLRSLPSEWDTHVVVWMNKPDFDTMGLDDLYNNRSTGNIKVNTASTEISTASFCDATVYAFLSTQP